MNGPRYKVAFTGLASEQLKAVVRRGYDKPALFADAIRLLLEQLISKPNEVGEPMYRLQSMKMDVRRVALAPVYLEYGVHRTEPLVIVRRVVGMAERNSDYRSRPSVSNALHHTATGTFARTIK